MERQFKFIALVLAVAAIPLMGVGCGVVGLDGSSGLDLGSLLTCSTTPKTLSADLRWNTVQLLSGAGGVATGLPGDEVQMQMLLENFSDPDGDAIALPSNIRAFLSFDNRIDAQDYNVGEWTVNGIEQNGVEILVENFALPRPTSPPEIQGTSAINNDLPFADLYFPVVIPDPESEEPLDIGPDSITYNLIIVLDSANCIFESTPAGAQEPQTAEHERYLGPADGIPVTYVADDIVRNNQFLLPAAVVVNNPNLPNLQCRFREAQPGSIGMNGGIQLTEWEITNTGIGVAQEPYGARVYFSSDDDLDVWDRNITVPGIGTNNGLSLQVLEFPGDFTSGLPPLIPVTDPREIIVVGPDGLPKFDNVSPMPNSPEFATATNDDSHVVTTSLSGGEVVVWTIRVQIPFYILRLNTYVFQPPPGGLQPEPCSACNQADATPGAEVARWRWPSPPNVPFWVFTIYAPIPTIDGLGGNQLICQIDSTNLILEADETDNLSSRDGGGNGLLGILMTPPSGAIDLEPLDLTADFLDGFLIFNLQVSNNGPAANVSIVFQFSEDDIPQASDYYCERFWFFIPTSENYAIFVDNWIPNNTPGPGTWYVLCVLDDVLAIAETNENNNFVVSNNTVQIGAQF